MNNSSSEIDDYTLPLGFETANTIILSFMLVACVFGNVLVITAIGRTRKLRTPSNYLIINLSLCDMINAIAAIPFTLVWNRVYEFRTFPYGEFGCKLLWPLATYAKTCSVFTLAAIAVDCFLNISYMNVILTKKKVYVVLYVLHVLAVIAVIPYTVKLTYTDNGTVANCTESWDLAWQQNAYTISLFVIQYGIPLSVMSCFYALAWYRLYRRNKTVIEMSEEYEKKMEWSETGSMYSSDTDSIDSSFHDPSRLQNGFLTPPVARKKSTVIRKASVFSERINSRLLESETPVMRSRPRVIERKITRRKESLAHQRVHESRASTDCSFERTLLKNLRNNYEKKKERNTGNNHTCYLDKQRNSCSTNCDGKYRNSCSDNYHGKSRNSCSSNLEGKNRNSCSGNYSENYIGNHRNSHDRTYLQKHKNSCSINHQQKHRGSYSVNYRQKKGGESYSNSNQRQERRRSSTAFIENYRQSNNARWNSKNTRLQTFILSIKTKISSSKADKNSYFTADNNNYCSSSNKTETRKGKKFRNSSFLSQTSFVRHQQTVKILKMFTIVVIIFMCVELPNQLAWLIGNQLSVLIRVLMLLTYISSVVNCWIYGGFHTGIRKAYFQLLCCSTPGSRPDHTSTVSAHSMYDCRMEKVVVERNTSFNQMFEDAFVKYDSSIEFKSQNEDEL